MATIDTFREQTVAGIQWSVVNQFAQNIFQLAIGVLLARLLEPAVFGIIGMVTVFTGFANIFSDLGFGAALIHRQDVNDRHLSSVYWFNVAVGLLLTLLFIALAPHIAAFYGQPILLPLTRLVALNFVISAFGIVQNVLFKKVLDFRRLAFIRIGALIISGIIAVVLAMTGSGVWSLAIQSVAATSLITLFMWVLNDWSPSFEFDKGAFKDLLGFSTHKTGFDVLNYWVRNADDLLIGRILGASALGLYTKAYTLMLLPLTNISRVIGDVMFPALAMIQDDKPRVRRIYLQATKMIAFVTFPLMLGLLVVADNFVLAIFGNRWQGMIPLLELFCIVGLLQSIGTLNGNLFLSQGRADLQLKVGGTIGMLGIVAIVIGLNWGLMGVAYFYTFFSVIAFFPSVKIATGTVELKFRELLTSLLPILACAGVMAVLIRLLSPFLPNNWTALTYLSMQVTFGIIVYGGLVHLLKLSTYTKLRHIAVALITTNFDTIRKRLVHART